MNIGTGIVFQVIQSVLLVLIAPLMAGWVNQCRAWMQNKSGPGLFQPYRVLHKLFHKDAVLAHDASVLFWATPYVLFGCMWLAVGIVPALTTGLPFGPAADVIALVGIFALARVFVALAGMDVGTPFGTLGGRREMMIGFLAEPAMLMTVFTASQISHSTSLLTIVETLGQQGFVIYPSMAFAAVAFLMVLLAENARIPIDNPSTHLELTMIHEAMILEYSGRHLALVEWASHLKLTAYAVLGFALFLPWGIGRAGEWSDLPIALAALVLKMACAGMGLALLETISAKLRIFRAPEFLGAAFLLAALGLLTHFLLEQDVASLSFSNQLINLLAALLLLISFAMLTQRRILSLIDLFAWQGLVLVLSTVTVAYSTHQTHLYWSALITFVLKVVVLPLILHRLIRALDVRWDVETVINIPGQLLIGIALVIFSFNLAAPVSEIAGTVTRSTIGIATASILLCFLMMIVRRKAVSQVIGFLAMENGLFFAATSATYGMPMVVELGIALDVLVGTLIFGVFFFHIRATFESLDIHHLERLKER